MSDCIFCKAKPEGKFQTVKWFKDNFPVTEGHTLVTPVKHYEYIGDMPWGDLGDLLLTACEVAYKIKSEDKTVTGFNIGLNQGESAGQTIKHVHVHVIPRRDGDCENPKGGVRGVIPSKQKY